MTVHVLPRIKRFVEGTAKLVLSPTYGGRARLHGKDFMNQDLTGSARLHVR